MDQELKEYLVGMEGRISGQAAAMEARLGERIDDTNRRIDDTNRSMAAMEARLIDRIAETARDMQTELLRGIAAYAESTSIRMRKLEADQSNLDAALSGRMAVMEKRLFEIEQRLGGMTH
jgi:hypothetical protein